MEALVTGEVPMASSAHTAVVMETGPSEDSPSREMLMVAGGPVVEEMVLPQEALGADEEARVNPHHPEAEVTPTGISGPSSPQGRPQVDTHIPGGGVQGLVVTSGTSSRRLYCADAIQAAHHYLDKLGVDLGAEEKRLGMERALLVKAWARFREKVENGCKVEEAARLCREKARVDTQKICRGAGEKAEATLAGVQERLAHVENR
jgi:hypothetical protein